MALPPNATAFSGPMDPADIVDYQYTLTQGATGTETLQVGESVASFTLALTAEASDAGLVLMTGGTPSRTPTLTGLLLRFWCSVSAGMQGDARFGGGGVSVGVELTIVTNASPARTKQRTLVIQIANQ